MVNAQNCELPSPPDASDPSVAWRTFWTPTIVDQERQTWNAFLIPCYIWCEIWYSFNQVTNQCDPSGASECINPFWWTGISIGESITIYTETISSDCASVSDVYTCQVWWVYDKALPLFRYETCSATCTLPDVFDTFWFWYIVEGGTRTWYTQDTSTDCSSVEQVYTCTSAGIFNPTIPDPVYSTCNQITCTIPANLWGGTRNVGQTISSFSASTAPDCSTIETIHTCETSGDFSPTISAASVVSCTPTAALTCDFPVSWRDGFTDLSQNQTVDVYTANSWTCTPVTLACNNGNFTQWWNIVSIGSYFPSCTSTADDLCGYRYNLAPSVGYFASQPNIDTNSLDGFCVLGTTYNQDIVFSISLGTIAWTCSNGGETQTCQLPLRATVTPICGQWAVEQSIAPWWASIDEFPRSINGELCITPSGMELWDAIQIGNAVWWWATQNPWTRDCFGTPTAANYYNRITCQVESAWACGATNDNGYLDLDGDESFLCANGVIQNFTELGTSFSWNCIGSQNLTASCGTPKLAAPVNGQCNNALNNQVVYYADVVNKPLCTQWQSTLTITDNPVGQQRVYTCQGEWAGSSDVWCTITQKIDGVCETYAQEFTNPPSSLCQTDFGNITPTNNGWGQRERQCFGANGGNISPTCTVDCPFGLCGTTPVCTNGALVESYPHCTTCPTGQDLISGQCDICPAGTTYDATSQSCAYEATSACTNNATNYPLCNVCGGSDVLVSWICTTCPSWTTYNTSTQLCDTNSTDSWTTNTCDFDAICDNNESVVSCPDDCSSRATCGDGNIGSVDEGEVCTDCDWCLCGSNSILNNTTCNSYIGEWFTGVYDGDADLGVIYHEATIPLAERRASLWFEIDYVNHWPEVATGTFLSYKRSPLYTEIDSPMPFTLSGDEILFYLGNLAPGASWSILISGEVQASFKELEIVNTAQIYTNRINDPNPTNNTKIGSVEIDDEVDEMSPYLVNPLLVISDYIRHAQILVDWVQAPTVYKDLKPWHPRYMHIMTVIRNGLMVWYEYKYARVFSPKRCISRGEYVIVMGRIMHMDGDSDVHDSEYDTTAYADVQSNYKLARHINRAYSRWILNDLPIKTENGQQYFEPNKWITHEEAKKIIAELYRIMGADPKVLKPLLLPQEDAVCVTREEAAYTISHILRGNKNITMWLNDLFLDELYERLEELSVIERRKAITRINFRLRNVLPGNLFSLWLDGETLEWLLSASMRGKQYEYNDAMSAQEFFYEVTEDDFEDYLKEMFLLNSR